MSILVDTDVLIWHLRGYPQATKRLNQLPALILSSVSYFELLQGMRNKVELQALKKMLALRSAQLLPVTPTITERAGALLEALTLSHGLGIGHNPRRCHVTPVITRPRKISQPSAIRAVQTRFLIKNIGPLLTHSRMQLDGAQALGHKNRRFGRRTVQHGKLIETNLARIRQTRIHGPALREMLLASREVIGVRANGFTHIGRTTVRRMIGPGVRHLVDGRSCQPSRQEPRCTESRGGA